MFLCIQIAGFRWSDGSAVDFLNWDTNHPKPYGGCIKINRINGKWQSAAHCTNGIHWLCKIAKGTTIVVI